MLQSFKLKGSEYMLGKFKKGVTAPEKILDKAREIMTDVVTYRMSGNIDNDAFGDLKIVLNELEENHCLNSQNYKEGICFEPDKIISSLNVAAIIGNQNPREIALPIESYATYIVSYCRENIAEVLSNYALRFNRDKCNTVTELRETIHSSALDFAVSNFNSNVDKINLIIRDENNILKAIKPRDEEVGKAIVKSMLDNFDMFYIRKVYLEELGIIDKHEDNIRNTIFKIKFYNNSLYILRVLLNLNIKSAGSTAIDLGIANCCRISGVKLVGDLDVVIASLEKFANRKGILEFDYIEKVAKDIDDFHSDIIHENLDYNLVSETINLLTKNVDLNLIREITAKIALLLLTKYKSGKLGLLEKLCILDGIMNKAF